MNLENTGNQNIKPDFSSQEVLEEVDLSAEFSQFVEDLKNNQFEARAKFNERLRQTRARNINIVVDLSEVDDDNLFIRIARLSKSILESGSCDKRIHVKIFCSAEQWKLEPNVFASGVEYQEIDKKMN